MINFKVEAWTALAPSLENKDDWNMWLADPQPINDPSKVASLKQIPPLLRRRFNMLGKCAMGAILQLLNDEDKIPSIFASRHGDTPLTLSLLEAMGRDEPMSPTSFSLAVHNAVSGLYSIARKDTSEVTAIAAMNGLIVNALLEAVGQLQNSARVLCVIYDIPLPELYQSYSVSESFPYGIAMILNAEQGESYSLEHCQNSEPMAYTSKQGSSELISFMRLLTGLSTKMQAELNSSQWMISKLDLDAAI